MLKFCILVLVNNVSGNVSNNGNNAAVTGISEEIRSKLGVNQRIQPSRVDRGQQLQTKAHGVLVHRPTNFTTNESENATQQQQNPFVSKDIKMQTIIIVGTAVGVSLLFTFVYFVYKVIKNRMYPKKDPFDMEPIEVQTESVKNVSKFKTSLMQKYSKDAVPKANSPITIYKK
jgi:hypothetical protein